jgi:outer membrane protein assembly factor BamD (BamD/ComL family)
MLAGAAVLAAGQAQNSDEVVARRQLESGRTFAQQGKYNEALKDFRAVADTHSATSVADNALLEIARYYLDVVGDTKEAAAAVDAILKKYPTSDSAPDAHLMVGRLALARGRGPADLDTALASFDRVLALFPASDAVPRALVLAGQTLWHAGRYDDALANFGRVQVEYSTHESAADAYVAAGRVLVSQGDPILAMEEMQQARNRWPASAAAARALDRISLLHRLYSKGKGTPLYTASAETVGPPRLENVFSLLLTPRGALYYANEESVGVAAPATATPPPAARRPRVLTMDATGQVFVIEEFDLRGVTGPPIRLLRPRQGEDPEPLKNIRDAVQLSTGEWLIADEDTRGIHKFSPSGDYGGLWGQAKLSGLALNAVDEVAGIDRDQKVIVTFDRTGKPIDRLPFRGGGYQFENVEDVAFDEFGHLYVLDREAVGIFTPHPPGKDGVTAPAAPADPRTPPSRYRLVSVFSELATKVPTAFRRATAIAVDPTGALYLYDADRAKRIKVYR